MATKRDQLQSHQFLAQRMVSALVTRESDPEQPPFRRVASAGIGGLAVAMLALAGTGVFGVLSPGGNKAWRNGDVVVVEKETGTRYVYVGGRLHPVMNYTSGLLALGKYAKTKAVSARSLRGVPRGPRIGIPDAPDALPEPKRLLTGAWTACSQPGTDVTGAPANESVVLVGHEPVGGTPTGDAAILAVVPETGARYLIARGRRHPIDPRAAVSVGLALGAQPWQPVGMAVVELLPMGEALGPIKLANTGRPSAAIPGRSLIGQLYVVKTTGGVDQYYLAEARRLRPISALQYDIQRAFSSAAYRGKTPYAISLDLVTAGRAVPPQMPAAPAEGALPSARPSFVAARNGPTIFCATFSPGSAVPRLTVDPLLPPADPLTITAGRTSRGTALADRVVVAPGTAALIEIMPSSRTPAGTLALVTDMGRLYPLAGPDLLKTLGYDSAHPTRLPAPLTTRIPRGTPLTASAATQQPTP